MTDEEEKILPRRETYSDTFTGEADSHIREILYDRDEGSQLKKLLLNVIKNELTERQKEIIMLYYFKEMDIVTIAKLKNISPQAVSALMARARMRIFRIMKYYVRGSL